MKGDLRNEGELEEWRGSLRNGEGIKVPDLHLMIKNGSDAQVWGLC